MYLRVSFLGALYTIISNGMRIYFWVICLVFKYSRKICGEINKKLNTHVWGVIFIMGVLKNKLVCRTRDYIEMRVISTNIYIRILT